MPQGPFQRSIRAGVDARGSAVPDALGVPPHRCASRCGLRSQEEQFVTQNDELNRIKSSTFDEILMNFRSYNFENFVWKFRRIDVKNVEFRCKTEVGLASRSRQQLLNEC